MSTLESGPKLDWTRDNQMYERYRIWRKKEEFIFCSALADSTPKQLVSYLKYWMGDQGIPLIEKWESTGKLDYVAISVKMSRCQDDIFPRIELIPSFVLSSDNTNCKNDIQLFHQLFDELSVHTDYH